MSVTIWQSDAVGADGNTVELGRDGARSMATEERAGKQWFLTPLSALFCIEGYKQRDQESFLIGPILGARRTTPRIRVLGPIGPLTLPTRKSSLPISASVKSAERHLAMH